MPGARKHLRQRRHHRAAQLDLRVAPAVGQRLVGSVGTVCRVSGRNSFATAAERTRAINTADVDAAGVGHVVIHHQQLTVVAVVDVQQAAVARAVVGAQRVELAHRHAAVRQTLEKGVGRADGAYGVHQQRHLYARRSALQQQRGHFGGDTLVFDDVTFQQHTAAGLRDGGFHGAESGGSVHQQPRAVAAVQVHITAAGEHPQVQSQQIVGPFGCHAAQRAVFLRGCQHTGRAHHSDAAGAFDLGIACRQ